MGSQALLSCPGPAFPAAAPRPARGDRHDPRSALKANQGAAPIDGHQCCDRCIPDRGHRPRDRSRRAVAGVGTAARDSGAPEATATQHRTPAYPAARSVAHRVAHRDAALGGNGASGGRGDLAGTARPQPRLRPQCVGAGGADAPPTRLHRGRHVLLQRTVGEPGRRGPACLRRSTSQWRWACCS